MSYRAILSNYSCWIWLYYYLNTSGNQNLSPYLGPKAMLSVVGTCCKANGFKADMALLKDAI